MISLELSNAAVITLRGTDTLVKMVGHGYIQHLMDEIGFLTNELDKYTGKLNRYESEKMVRSIIRSQGLDVVTDAIKEHEEDSLDAI